MKKPQSMTIFDDIDFPISLVRKSIFQGTGCDMDELKDKPIIAIASSATDINPGHMHLSLLSKRAKEGVHAAGGIPFEFNVPAPCDPTRREEKDEYPISNTECPMSKGKSKD